MDFKDKVTEISKKAGKVATDTYNSVADKSGKLFEEAKARLNISDKEREITKIYESMGLSVYENYSNGEDVGKNLAKESKKIDKIKAEIEELNKKILFNKGFRTCDTCDQIIPIEAVFCNNCGAKQKSVKIKEDKKTSKKDEVKDIPKEKVCPQCGNIEQPESKFCMKCGYKL